MTSQFLMPILVGTTTVDYAVAIAMGLGAIVMALLAVTRRNPLYSAVLLIGFFIAVAVLYFLLAAPFIGIMQVLVYAGAIMVLYTFIIMLLDLSPQDPNLQIPAVGEAADVLEAGAGGAGAAAGDEPLLNLRALFISGGTFACLAWCILKAQEIVLVPRGPDEAVHGSFFKTLREPVEGFGTTGQVGKSMFTEWALPFEIVGVMLLVAAISGVVLAKRVIADRAEDTSGLGRGLAK